MRDFAAVAGTVEVDAKLADDALRRLEVDEKGLDSLDRRYLSCIGQNYAGGPVGVETFAAALSEQRDALEEVIEPFLIQQGFLQRTSRGRALTTHGFCHLGMEVPKPESPQFELIEEGSDE